MPRFVLLRHELPTGEGTPSHWDLMLQQGDSLLTWRLESLPAAWLRPQEPPGGAEPRPFAAVRLADHRLAYLDYEGPISDGRGEVRRVDGGWYFPHEETTNRLHAELYGAVIKNYVLLEHIGSGDWRLLVGDEPFS